MDLICTLYTVGHCDLVDSYTFIYSIKPKRAIPKEATGLLTRVTNLLREPSIPVRVSTWVFDQMYIRAIFVSVPVRSSQSVQCSSESDMYHRMIEKYRRHLIPPKLIDTIWPS